MLTKRAAICVHNTEERACKAQCCVCPKVLPLILPLGHGRKDNFLRIHKCMEAQRKQARWLSSYRQEACVSNAGGFSSQACLYKLCVPSFNYYCMSIQMCEDALVVFACMSVHMNVEASGKPRLSLLRYQPLWSLGFLLPWKSLSRLD